MYTEQISDLGSVMIKKETNKGEAVIPTIAIPIFNETLMEDMKVQSIDPIMGLKAMRFAALKGQREYKGLIDFLGEPNIAGYVFDMLLNKVSTTGSGPYTHVFALNTTNPKSYTIDIARGRIVFRFFGVEAREVASKFEDNRHHLVSQVSALGAFGPRQITNVSTLALTLDTAYDPNPTLGLVATDLIRIFKADGTVVDTTLTSIDSASVITVGAATGVAAGDWVALRPATASYSLSGNYFQFARTEYRFSDTIANALAATHTPVEKGSDWKIIHQMLPEAGALRSGSYNPVSLPRGRGDIELKTKMFFDSPEQKDRLYRMGSRACVIRHFAGATNQHELRVTLDQIVQKSNPTNLKVGEILFDDIDWLAEYNTSNGKSFGVTVINGVATI